AAASYQNLSVGERISRKGAKIKRLSRKENLGTFFAALRLSLRLCVKLISRLINRYMWRGSGRPADRCEIGPGKLYLDRHVSSARQRSGQGKVYDVKPGHLPIWSHCENR